MSTRSEHRTDTTRRVRLASVLGLTLCLLLTSCASSGQVHHPRNDEEAFVIRTIDAMAEALSAGDIDRVMAKVSNGYYRGYTPMEERLRKGRAIMATYAVTTAISGVESAEGKTTVRVKWQARWTAIGSSAEGQRSGDNTLVFMRSTLGIKLIDQAEDNLFGI